MIPLIHDHQRYIFINDGTDTMRLLNTLSILAGLIAYTSAANSFSGSNLYYAAGLTQAQQTTLFTGLKDAGVKVLRVWLDGKTLKPSNSTFVLH